VNPECFLGNSRAIFVVDEYARRGEKKKKRVVPILAPGAR
jgi:hypothetical protein